MLGMDGPTDTPFTPWQALHVRARSSVGPAIAGWAASPKAARAIIKLLRIISSLGTKRPRKAHGRHQVAMVEKP
jgi:hypothetical protein